MARELPIHNGRMTTDLDANGFKINNLPPGSGFTQVQSDWSQADSTAPDFIKNKPTIPVLPTLATVATSGSYDDLTDKPTIPAPVDISGKADKSEMSVTPGTGANADKTMIQLKSGTSAMVLTLHQDISGKANTSDVATELAQKADATDLPYAMVTPGEWEFSGVPDGVADVGLSWSGTAWDYTYAIGTIAYSGRILRPITEPPFDGNELSLTFSIESSTVTATRVSLPGHLCDRAGNRVVVSGDTTLTLPALVNAGKARDFLVRLEISGSTVPTITFAAPTGETLTYEVDGDEFPVPDEAGTWLYSFTETAAHTFAVSLKKVNTVAQGGA